MVNIEPINLWGFYGLFFSGQIRKIIEQDLLRFEKEKREVDNWPPRDLALRDENNKFIFTFTLKDESIEEIEIKMDKKIFFSQAILCFSNVEYYGVKASAPFRGAYFFRSEKEPLERIIKLLLEEVINKI